MTARPKGGLGRGLSALIPGAEVDSRDVSSVEIDIARIKVRSDQPRTRFNPILLEELIQSVRTQGVLQPLLVTPRDNKYLLVAGERRLRAAKAVELFTVPCRIMEGLNDQQILEISIVENLQREDLNPIELAAGYKRLIEELKLNQKQVGDRVGKDRTTVANTIRLLNLPNPIIEMINEGKLSSGHARALLAIESDNIKMALARETLTKNLSVRNLEKIVKNRQKPRKKPETKTQPEIHSRNVAKKLSESLGYPVRIAHKGPGGKVTIKYSSLEELDNLVEFLQSRARNQ